MTKIIELAHGLAQELADHNAEISLAPDYELSEVAREKVLVVPISPSLKIAARTAVEEVYDFDIGILYRARNMDLVQLLAMSERIGRSLLRRSIGDCVVVSAEWPAFYDPEALRTKNLFVSVLRVRLKRIC